MPLINFYSVRVMDPDFCSDPDEAFYGTIVPSKNGRITKCILKQYGKEIKGKRPTKEQWRKYGETQRYLLSKDIVVPCKKEGKNSLCPKEENGKENESGRKWIKSIEAQFGSIVKMRGEPYEYRVTRMIKNPQ